MESTFRQRLKTVLKIMKVGFIHLFFPNKPLPAKPTSRYVNDYHRIITDDDEETLRQLRISLIGKMVQGYWDDGEIDDIGKGLCIEVDHRDMELSGGQSAFVYDIQYPDGERNRILNAKIV